MVWCSEGVARPVPADEGETHRLFAVRLLQRVDTFVAHSIPQLQEWREGDIRGVGGGGVAWETACTVTLIDPSLLPVAYSRPSTE